MFCVYGFAYRFNCNYKVHCESEKLDPFYFELNFGKYCPILIILSLLQTEIICAKTIIEFATSPVDCCCITLKNATTYTSSQKLLNKFAMHAVISLLSQSK